MANKPPFLKYALTLRKVLSSTWGKVSSDQRLALLSAAESWDVDGVRSAMTALSVLGPAFVEKLGSRPEEILSSALKSSTSYWSAHAAKESGKSSSAIRRSVLKSVETLASLADAQIASFAAKFPERIIHPGILSEIEKMVSNPHSAASDILILKSRLERLAVADAYMDGLSQVQVARLWQANGIQMAHADGVKRMQIIEMMDKKTCPVCVKSHGMEIDCSKAAKQVDKGLRITDPDEYVAFWPFPRYPEVQQWSPEDWLRDGRFPPFHNRCRGQVRFLYGGASSSSSSASSSPRAPKPQGFFKDPAAQNAYDAMSKRVAGMSEDELLAIWKSEFKDYHKVTSDRWASSAQNEGATALKFQAKKLEKLSASIRKLGTKETASSFVARYTAQEGQSAATVAFSDIKYAEMRALCQEFLKTKYGDALTLYRGIDGKVGEKMARKTKKLLAAGQKTTINIDEDCLTGWTTELEVAKKFGLDYWGIVVKKKVPIEDIVMPPEFFSILKETEFIVRNKSAKMKTLLDDILT